ncbi:MAG: cytochrome P450 [Gemmatimonadaceae bacterium]
MPASPPAPLPPGPKPRYFGEHVVALARDRLGFLRKLARDHGDIAHVRIGPGNLVLLNHPDLIRDVLVTHNRNFVKGRGLQRARKLLGDGLLTSEGERHLRQRRLAQPAFHRERITAYGAIMSEYAERAGARWSDSAVLDLATEMARLTLGIAGKTLFDSDVEEEASEIGEALTDALKLFSIAVLPFSELMDRLPLPWTIRFNRARARLDTIIYRIIAERRAHGGDRGDLLSMLMLARDGEGDGTGMTDEQIRDEVMTLLLAGHETTANALAWTWYLLARNPEQEARLHVELLQVLGGRAPTVEDVPRLAYTRMVLAESMRLYPPAWVVGYQALADQPLGDFVVPTRSFVLMSPFIMHRDERYYPDPERFDPERWTPEAQQSRPRFGYFPFGGGPRQCIGEQFAWMEGIIIIATLAQRWRFHLAAGHVVEPKAIFTLRPRGGMPMRAERRAR